MELGELFNLLVMAILIIGVISQIFDLLLELASWLVIIIKFILRLSPLILGLGIGDLTSFNISSKYKLIGIYLVSIGIAYLGVKLIGKLVDLIASNSSTGTMPLGYLLIGANFYISYQAMNSIEATVVNRIILIFLGALPLILIQTILTYIWYKYNQSPDAETLIQDEELWRRIDKMSGREFEEFLVDVYQSNGFEVNLVGSREAKSGKLKSDMGLDLILRDDQGQIIGIQAKRYDPDNSYIGVQQVQETYSGAGYYDCDQAWLVTTTNKVSNDADKTAAKLGVQLIQREDLHQHLVESEICQSSTDQSQQSKSAPVCPECGSQMVVRSGNYGEFWGCSNYPDCKTTIDYK